VRQLRSGLALLLALSWILVIGTLVQRLFLWPLSWFCPDRMRGPVSAYMRLQARGILFFLSLVGGARFERRGWLPTAQGPILILMNHQSLVDILSVILLADYVPAFVTRRRYTRFGPIVAHCTRLLGCPSIDPRRDPSGAVRAIEDAARGERHGLLIFPEGHRTLDGQIRPFRTAGAEAVLRAGRWPVWLVVTEGFESGRRLADFLLNIPRLRGQTEVLGPFTPPEDPARLQAFLLDLREVMVRHLAEMRARHASH
jgi:1-acyl-sn-glycerol-3-phosphate acyltransferase